MTKYEIIAITTLKGEPKADNANKGRIGMVGNLKFYDMSTGKHMTFMSNKYFKGFITSKVINDKEEVDGNITKRIITTQNSIYVLKELMEEVCD